MNRVSFYTSRGMVMCIAFIVVAFFLPVVIARAQPEAIRVIACAWIASLRSQ
jgi:hypothetical protein